MIRRFGLSAIALAVSLLVMFALFRPHRSSTAPPGSTEISSVVETGVILASTMPTSPTLGVNPLYLPSHILAEPGLRAAVFNDRSRESFVSSVVAGRTSIYRDGSSPCRYRPSAILGRQRLSRIPASGEGRRA